MLELQNARVPTFPDKMARELLTRTDSQIKSLTCTPITDARDGLVVRQCE